MSRVVPNPLYSSHVPANNFIIFYLVHPVPIVYNALSYNFLFLNYLILANSSILRGLDEHRRRYVYLGLRGHPQPDRQRALQTPRALHTHK
jgi:hypothetical protein